MTVYVDDAAIQATVGRHQSRWSHLTADTQDELHAFAAKIGLKRAWFQPGNKSGLANPGSFSAESWHYDVTEGKRRQAITAGAVAVTGTDLSAIILSRAPATCGARSEKEPGPRCAERGCVHRAGGRWSPYFCPCCDGARVRRISGHLEELTLGIR